MNLWRSTGLAMVAAAGLLAAGCAVVPTPDGAAVVPAPLVVSPPIVFSPWWHGYGYYGPRYYGGPRYYSRPVPAPPRYWGPGGGPSFPPPMR